VAGYVSTMVRHKVLPPGQPGIGVAVNESVMKVLRRICQYLEKAENDQVLAVHGPQLVASCPLCTPIVGRR
jgi:hypothetical protein